MWVIGIVYCGRDLMAMGMKRLIGDIFCLMKIHVDDVKRLSAAYGCFIIEMERIEAEVRFWRFLLIVILMVEIYNKII